MTEGQKLQFLQRKASRLDYAGLDPCLVAAAQTLIAHARDGGEAKVALMLHGNRGFRIFEEKRFKSTGKTTGLTRLWSIQSSLDGSINGRLVEKTVLRPNSPNGSGFWLNEAMFYTSVRGQLDVSDLLIPRLHGLDATESHCRIFIEYIQNCRPATSESDLIRLARALGSLAAQTKQLPQFDMEWLPSGSHRVSLESLERFKEFAATLAAQVPAVRDAQEKFEQFIGAYDAINAGRRASGCLCHGDAHDRNLVVAGTGANAALLDWSHIGRGYFGDDLVSILAKLILHPSLWGGDLITANKAILESYGAGLLSVLPHTNPGLIRRSYTIGVILFFLARSQFLLNCLTRLQSGNARLVTARRLARLLNRHAAIAQSLAAAENARNGRP